MRRRRKGRRKRKRKERKKEEEQEEGNEEGRWGREERKGKKRPAGWMEEISG